MNRRKFKKLISVMLCLFTISFMLAAAFINVSAATTYFKAGDKLKIDTTLDFPFGEFGVYVGSGSGTDSEDLTFVYQGQEFPNIVTEAYFTTFGFGFSWYPNISRNIYMAGSNIVFAFNMDRVFGQWYQQIKYDYELDPADFFTLRVSPNALGNPNQWVNGTYYNNSTLIRPQKVQVISDSTASTSSSVKIAVAFQVPKDTGSIICEFTAAADYGLNFSEPIKVVEFGYVVNAMILNLVYIDESVADLAIAKGELTDSIDKNNELTGDLSEASDKVDEMIDKDAALSAMDESNLDISNVISSSKYNTLSMMLDDFWDSLGAELEFVLTFTLVIGLAIFLLGKKAKS